MRDVISAFLGIVIAYVICTKWIYRDKRVHKPTASSVLGVISEEFGIDFIFFKNAVQVIFRDGTAFAFPESDFNKFIEELKSEYEKAQ